METEETNDNSLKLIEAFGPIKFLLTIIGQMPYEIKLKKDSNVYAFKFHYKSISFWVFLLVVLLQSAVYFAVTAGVVTFFFYKPLHEIGLVNITHQILAKDIISKKVEIQYWERYYTRKSMVSVFVIWSWMTITFIGALNVILNGKFYTHYINYFNRVVQLMDMDMTEGVKHKVLKHNLLTVATGISLLIGLAGTWVNFEAVEVTALVIANFLLRNFNIEIGSLNSTHQLYGKAAAAFMTVFSLIGSRAVMLQFVFFSLLLKNGCIIWNERFQTALEHATPANLEDQTARRTSLKSLLKDHLILVQLFRLTESVFGNTLISYYFFVIITVVLEIYELAALGGFDTEEGSESSYELDDSQSHGNFSSAVVSMIFLIQNIYFCVATTTDAAQAYEQAMEGFQILRQHGFMYCNNKAERNFVLNMFISFSKNAPLQLSGGGYFAINKALLVALSGLIVNWAVSIYQTRIDQWK